MSLTKIGSIGINTGIQLAGVTTVSTLHVGSGVTLSSDGDGFFTGITSFTRNVTGDFAVRISNTHATGQGLNIRGGSANGQYALLVEDYAAANLFEINGDGEVEVKANHLRANHGVVVTGIVTATSFAGSGANLTGIDTDLVSDTSPQLGGNLDVNSKTINLGDSSGETVNRIRLGADNDGDLFHDGSDLLLREVDSGQILLRSDGAKVFANSSGSANQAIFRANGNVELYNSGNKKFETSSGGIIVTGQMYSNSAQIVGAAGGDSVLELYSDAGGQNADKVRIRQTHVGNSFLIESYASGAYQSILKGTDSRTIELHYQGSKKFETFASGVRWTGQLHCPTAGDTLQFTGANSNAFLLGMTSGADTPTGSDEHLQFHHWNGSAWEKTFFFQRHSMTVPDGNKIQLGDSADLEFHHSSGSNYCDIANGQQLYFRVNSSNKFYVQSGGAQFVGSLYGDDDNKIELGSGQDLKLMHDGSHSYVQAYNTGNLYLGCIHNGDVIVRQNSQNRYQFAAGGFNPLTDNVYDLGNSSYRWRNLYTGDINLSNKGSQNDVDGTWGDYTIQEGESDLFLINKRSGKKFKFMLQEVS